MVNFIFFLLFVFAGVLLYNIFLKEWIKQIKRNIMFKANHNCKNCKHYRYYAGECKLAFYRDRDYVGGEETKIYQNANFTVGTRKCHWDPREEKNV